MHQAIRITTTLILFVSLFGSFTPTPAAPVLNWDSKVDPWVLSTATSGDTEFVVFLMEQADLSGAAQLETKLEKGRYVFQRLTEIAARTQGPVLDALDQLGVEHRSYWVANMVWARGDLQAIEAMALRSDVAHIYANPTVHLDEPGQGSIPRAALAPDTVEWNILRTNADDVWAAGYTGQGAVIAGQDTGYDWDHPALINQYRGWDGAADHNYNWHDAIHSGGGVCGPDSPQPCDDHSHGTHTMGTMVGDDGGSNQIGMAPGARWIGCRNMDQGDGTPTTYAECYQWFIAPTDLNNQNPRPDLAPDVINNSWGCPPSEGCTDPNVLLTVVNNVRAAGILTAHSAGNSGSSCASIDEPAALYDASFTVGATDSSDNIAGFSSRGPVTVDGSNRPKPDISAPGVGIRSSVPGGGYQSGWSGTSMAAPHVAGLVGLLISANPALSGQVDDLEDMITASALPRTTTQTCGGVPGSNIPNNTYGWGRIDALAALQFLTHEFSLQKTASSPQVAPGQVLTYTLQITHAHPTLPTGSVVLTDTLPAGVSFVSATQPYSFDGTTVRWDFTSMNPNETRTTQLVVQVSGGASGSVLNDDYAVRSDDVLTTHGSTVETEIVPFSLELSKSAPGVTAPSWPITYTLRLTNPHPFADLHALVLTDTIPAGTTFITATLPYVLDQGVIRWEFNSLAAQEIQRLRLVVQPELEAGTITNQVYSASSLETGLVTGPAVSTEVLPQSLGIEIDAEMYATPGSVLTYTLRANNPHPVAPLTNLVMTDTLPANTSIVSASGAYTIQDETVTWTLPQLGPGSVWEETLSVQVPVTFTGNIFNQNYGVHSDQVPAQTGPPVESQIHDLALSKTVSSGGVFSGEILTYTLTVTNLHPSAAVHELVLRDRLPSGTIFVSTNQPYNLLNGEVTWLQSELASGGAWEVELVVQALPVGAQIRNEVFSVQSLEVAEPITGEDVLTDVFGVLFFPLIYSGQ